MMSANPGLRVARGTQIDLLELFSNTVLTTEERISPSRILFARLRSFTNADWGHLNELHFKFNWPVEALLAVPTDKNLSAALVDAAEAEWIRQNPNVEKAPLVGYNEQDCKVHPFPLFRYLIQNNTVDFVHATFTPLLPC